MSAPGRAGLISLPGGSESGSGPGPQRRAGGQRHGQACRLSVPHRASLRWPHSAARRPGMTLRRPGRGGRPGRWPGCHGRGPPAAGRGPGSCPGQCAAGCPPAACHWPHCGRAEASLRQAASATVICRSPAPAGPRALASYWKAAAPSRSGRRPLQACGPAAVPVPP